MPWLRYIIPEKELITLGKRQQTDYNSNACHYKSLGDTDFDPLSSFHYHLQNVYQIHFSDRNNTIGILIKINKDEPRKIYWRHSGMTKVSDHIFKSVHTAKSFEKILRDYQFKVISETNVPKIVEQDYKLAVKENERDRRDYEKEYGKKLKREAFIVWTEGLFRYKANEIFSIVVDKDNKTTHKSAYEFAKVLEEKFEIPKFKFFCYYDDKEHQFCQLSRKKI